MVGWRENLKCIGAMAITEDTIAGKELLNTYIDTTVQNSRGNSRQLHCLARIKILTLGVSVYSKNEPGKLRNICSWLLLCPVGSARPFSAKCL
jgi:hypothetical protein